MRKPSVKTLSTVFSDPMAARAIFDMNHAELSTQPAAAARIRECYHAPAWSDVRMHALAALDNGLFGIESIEAASGEYADYLNAGDTYAPTVIYWRGQYRVQSIGDFVERSRVSFK